MSYLDFTSLAAVAPYNPPAGWFKPASAQSAQITQISGVGLVRRYTGSGNQSTAILDNTTYTGNTIFAEVLLGANATINGTSAPRCALLNSSGDGYAFWSAQDSLSVRIYEVVNYVFGATEVWSATGYGAGASQIFNFRCSDKSTGTFKVLRNGVQVGTDFVSTKYTGLVYSGVFAAGSGVLSITTGAIADWASVTNPITMGGAISAVTSGFSNVTSISGGGMSATGLSFNAGTNTTSGTWPALSESLAPTIALPATNVTLTLTDGATSRTRTSNINLPANFNSTEVGTPISDDKYLYPTVPIAAGNYMWYDNTQLGGMTLYPDGRIDALNAGTFTMFLHKFGGDNSVTQYNVTAAGSPVEVPPIMPADRSVTVSAGATILGAFVATSGTAPVTYSLSGASASLFSINASTGLVSFISPAAEGAGSLTVVATNEQGSDSQVVSFTVRAGILPTSFAPARSRDLQIIDNISIASKLARLGGTLQSLLDRTASLDQRVSDLES